MPTIEWEVKRLASRLGREPPDELMAFASLKYPSLFDYGLDGVARLALVERPPELDDEGWTAVARLRPFWFIEMELDGTSSLPEVIDLGLSAPEDLEAPTWILELAITRDKYRLVGRPERAYEGDVRILSTGSLADVLQVAIDAQLKRLPTIAKWTEELNLDKFEVPAVTVAEAEQNDEFAGQSVMHAKFGWGTIIEHQPGETFVVDFGEHGTRKLLGRFLDFD